jgi:hypothetical protein
MIEHALHSDSKYANVNSDQPQTRIVLLYTNKAQTERATEAVPEAEAVYIV